MASIPLPDTQLKHIVSTRQFDNLNILKQLFETTDKIRSLEKDKQLKLLPQKLLATIFYEPSTRTRLSFETAMYRLGGQVISTENAGVTSSAVKGESIEDTVRTLGMYADAIVIRHPEQGTVVKAAKESLVPVISAGDGAGEHPTQALLDLYTLLKHLNSLANKRIALVGDLRYGRTTHSLINLLSLYKNTRIILVAPRELSLPSEFKKYQQIEKEVSSITDIKGKVDAMYVTRIQKERFPDATEYEKIKQHYVINQASLKTLRQNGVIMHPLPRAGEITADIDKDPRAIYFEQMQNGVFVRMALLYWLLSKKG